MYIKFNMSDVSIDIPQSWGEVFSAPFFKPEIVEQLPEGIIPNTKIIIDFNDDDLENTPEKDKKLFVHQTRSQFFRHDERLFNQFFGKTAKQLFSSFEGHFITEYDSDENTRNRYDAMMMENGVVTYDYYLDCKELPRQIIKQMLHSFKIMLNTENETQKVIAMMMMLTKDAHHNFIINFFKQAIYNVNQEFVEQKMQQEAKQQEATGGILSHSMSAASDLFRTFPITPGFFGGGMRSASNTGNMMEEEKNEASFMKKNF